MAIDDLINECIDSRAPADSLRRVLSLRAAQGEHVLNFLHYVASDCAKAGAHEYLTVLKDAGVDMNRAFDDIPLPLHTAICEGHEDTVDVLLALGADPNVLGEERMTALHQAAKQDMPDFVREFVTRYGVPVDARAGDGYTPLHVAAVNGNMDALRALLDLGADVNACTDEGGRALCIALCNSHTEFAAVLSEAGAAHSVATV